MNIHTLPCREAPTGRAGAREVLSLREIIALADIPEKRVRKDIETGILVTPKVWRLDSRLCFPWDSVFVLAAVYSNKNLTGALRRIALDRMNSLNTFHDCWISYLRGDAMALDCKTFNRPTFC
jgi:hypothetical protein